MSTLGIDLTEEEWLPGLFLPCDLALSRSKVAIN